jgi:hypothetical protein
MASATRKLAGILLLMILSFFKLAAQISPGVLSSPHAHLEGISNCTQCHVLGNKVTNEKCLICHKDIKERITLQKGYHSSAEVKGKDCFVCHNDHHGKNFQLIRLDTLKFDHKLTGYSLSVPHTKKYCKECHKSEFITDTEIKNKKYTYFGLNDECLTCHTDYHQKTLSSDCLGCHNSDAFKPATKFKHIDTKFPLAGKHLNVECLKCHKIEIINGRKMQQFLLPKSVNCSACHNDPHKNKFGQNCNQCHTEESFQIVKGTVNFNHDKTDYPLDGKHLTVNCKACHKTKFSDPIQFKFCADCHNDYHKKQFTKDNVTPDCSLCHNLEGFNLFLYTIEQHNLSTFPLKGAHLAIPCLDCHKKQKDWNFKGIGIACKDCHRDIHKDLIPAKDYPEAGCHICHNENHWSEVSFDHSKTEFNLTGAHKKADCRDCHITTDSEGTILRDNKGNILQKFSRLPAECSSCHKDKHYRQFEKNGITICIECHDTENWNASKFDHNNAAFRLDGKHVNVPCVNCHKPIQEGSDFYVRYKLKDFKCESCHS